MIPTLDNSPSSPPIPHTESLNQETIPNEGGRIWKWLKQALPSFLYDVLCSISQFFGFKSNQLTHKKIIILAEPTSKTTPQLIEEPSPITPKLETLPVSTSPRDCEEQEEVSPHIDSHFQSTDSSDLDSDSNPSTPPSPLSPTAKTPEPTSTPQPTIAPSSPIAKPIFSNDSPVVQDVPGGGNCLFCSIALGLKKNNLKKHAVGDWIIDSSALSGNLVTKASSIHLPKIATMLRQEAITALSNQKKFQLTPQEFYAKHKNDPDEDVYNDIWINQIAGHDETVLEGIKAKKRTLNNLESKKAALPANKTAQQKIEESDLIRYIQDKKNEIIREENRLIKTYERFLDKMKADSFNCGPAQAEAIAKFYDAPIIIWEIRTTPDTGQSIIQDKIVQSIKVGDKYWTPIILGKECKGPIIHVLHATRYHFQHVNN